MLWWLQGDTSVILRYLRGVFAAYISPDNGSIEMQADRSMNLIEATTDRWSELIDRSIEEQIDPLPTSHRSTGGQ